MQTDIKAFVESNKCINYNHDFRFIELQEIDQETDWDDLVDAIYPYYVKSKTSHILLTVESMLRIYILTRHFEMSPSGIEKALFQVDNLRDFALIDLDRDEIPSAACITEFSSLLFEQSLLIKIEDTLKAKPIEAKHCTTF